MLSSCLLEMLGLVITRSSVSHCLNWHNDWGETHLAAFPLDALAAFHSFCTVHRSALSHSTALRDPSESLPVPPWPQTPAKQAQSRGWGWARLQPAAGCPFSPECREVPVGTSASSPWQEQSLRKMNTLMGKGALFPSLLKKRILIVTEIKCKAKGFSSYCGLLFTESTSDDKTDVWTRLPVAKVFQNRGYSSDLWENKTFLGKKSEGGWERA